MQLPWILGKKESHSGIRKGKSLYCWRWSLTDSWWRLQDMPAPANKGWCDMLGSPSSPTLLVQPLQHNPGCWQQPFGRSCFSDNAAQELGSPLHSHTPLIYYSSLFLPKHQSKPQPLLTREAHSHLQLLLGDFPCHSHELRLCPSLPGSDATWSLHMLQSPDRPHRAAPEVPAGMWQP